MTLTEFQVEFDILYNNIMSGVAPGLNNYEKSVFLTQAQEEILKNYFNPKSNRLQEGIEASNKRSIDFTKVLVNKSLTKIGTTLDTFSLNNIIYEVPSDMFIQRGFRLMDNTIQKLLEVTPVTTTELQRLNLKPHKFPYRNEAWLIHNGNYYEVIVHPKYLPDNLNLIVRYVRRPQPIILEDISNTLDEVGVALSINGITTPSDCELPESIHREILLRAIELAKVAYTVDNAQQMIQTNRAE